MRWVWPAVLVVWAAPLWADSAAPTATTATYGNWTVSCAQAADQAAQLCQMTTQLSMKGSDGQPHPLLQLAIGAPAGGKGLRIVVQVPGDVALRSGIEISLDKGAAGAVVPQEVLLSASYLACTAGGCLADAELGRDVLARLLAAKVANVSFVALTGAKKVMVPVALTGFADAAAALGLPGK